MFSYKDFLKRASPKKDIGSTMELIIISVDMLRWHKKFYKESREGRCVKWAVVWANRNATCAVS